MGGGGGSTPGHSQSGPSPESTEAARRLLDQTQGQMPSFQSLSEMTLLPMAQYDPRLGGAYQTMQAGPQAQTVAATGAGPGTYGGLPVGSTVGQEAVTSLQNMPSLFDTATGGPMATQVGQRTEEVNQALENLSAQRLQQGLDATMGNLAGGGLISGSQVQRARQSAAENFATQSAAIRAQNALALEQFLFGQAGQDLARHTRPQVQD